MPYASIEDFPPPVREYLPLHAREIYRSAFKTEYADCGEQREEIAYRIAWAAVKHRYPQGTKRVGAAVSGSFRCFDRDQIFPVTIGHMSRNQAPKVNSAP